MKLKKALKIAKKAGFDYVAVDRNKQIHMYGQKPETSELFWFSTILNIGTYTGSKDWKDTLRRVKK